MITTGLLFLTLFWGLAPDASALKRPAGRLEQVGRENLGSVPELLNPQQSSGVYPGLFELIPYGMPEVAVQPGWLYMDPDEASSSGTDYFAKRIEVPVDGMFRVPWAVVWIEPRAAGEIVPFPEVLLTREAVGGGPDLETVVFRRTELAPAPGSAELQVDFSDEGTVFQGPEVLYLVVRFPAGDSDGPKILLDTDQDYGLYPGSNYLAVGGEEFLRFEEAAGTVRNAFFGLDNFAPPGLAGDQLSMGMFVYTDSLSVPVYPPVVTKIVSISGEMDQREIDVYLQVAPVWSDGRLLDFVPDRIRVTHLRNDTYQDSLIAELDLEAGSRIRIPGLQDRTYLLRFAVLDNNGRAGQPSGAHLVLPADSNEPNDSRSEATSLDWSIPASSLWSETISDQAGVQHPADFDFYKLELSAGDSLVAGFEHLAQSYSDLDPVLSISDSSGLVLGYEEGSTAAVCLTAPYTGVYYLLVNDRAIFDGGDFVNEASRVYCLAARVIRRRGDVDGDGEIDYRDAFLVFVMTSGMQDTLSFTPAQRFAADYDGDGMIVGDTDDFIGVLFLAGYIPGRDPAGPSKRKSSGREVSLAGGQSWCLEFSDGSSLILSYAEGVTSVTPGTEAASLLALLEGVEPARTETAKTSITKLPGVYSLSQNSPNPFNPSTVIFFSLQKPGWVELEVFDIQGKRVRGLFRGRAPAGERSVFWDGTDSRGRKAASGVYFYRLRAGEFSQTRKMLLIK
jgi:flagellar hook capping protein FlgD